MLQTQKISTVVASIVSQTTNSVTETPSTNVVRIAIIVSLTKKRPNVVQMAPVFTQTNNVKLLLLTVKPMDVLLLIQCVAKIQHQEHTHAKIDALARKIPLFLLVLVAGNVAMDTAYLTV